MAPMSVTPIRCFLFEYFQGHRNLLHQPPGDHGHHAFAPSSESSSSSSSLSWTCPFAACSAAPSSLSLGPSRAACSAAPSSLSLGPSRAACSAAPSSLSLGSCRLPSPSLPLCRLPRFYRPSFMPFVSPLLHNFYCARWNQAIIRMTPAKLFLFLQR